jgi:hypothetical protein
MGEAIPDWAMLLIVIGIFFMLVMKFMADAGMGGLITGIRATRRVRVMDEPRDHLERLVNNHRKVAKDCKPPGLVNAVVIGDRDIPMHDYGKIIGLEPHDEGYIMYVQTSRLAWSKPHIVIRELAGDANRRNLFIDTRGFTTDGAFRWAIPNSQSGVHPTDAYLKSKALFDQIFNVQTYVDTQEDTAWAQASAIMPSVASRVQMASVEVPGKLIEQPQYSEREVLK